MSTASCGARTRSHSNRAVRALKGKDVINAITCHSDFMALGLHSLNEK